MFYILYHDNCSIPKNEGFINHPKCWYELLISKQQHKIRQSYLFLLFTYLL